MFLKIGVLKISAIFTGKHLCWSPLLIKVNNKLYLKETLTHVFSCDVAKLFKNSFFRSPPVAAFGYKRNLQSKIFQEISALKFRVQDAAQFRYDSLCSVTKREIHQVFLAKLQNSYFQEFFLGGGVGWGGDGAASSCRNIWFRQAVWQFCLAIFHLNLP